MGNRPICLRPLGGHVAFRRCAIGAGPHRPASWLVPAAGQPWNGSPAQCQGVEAVRSASLVKAPRNAVVAFHHSSKDYHPGTRVFPECLCPSRLRRYRASRSSADHVEPWHPLHGHRPKLKGHRANSRAPALGQIGSMCDRIGSMWRPIRSKRGRIGSL